MDTFTPEQRSAIMSRIRGRRNQTTEVALARLLRVHRVTGWRRHFPAPGRPDFAFPDDKVAVFVDGCFWHRCSRCASVPSSRREYWVRKLATNVKRDRRVSRELRMLGWKVVRLWEHELKDEGRAIAAVKQALDHRRRGQA